MLLDLRIKLSKPWLAAQPPDHRGIRRFKMNGDLVFVHTDYWKEQLRIAAMQLHYPIDVNTLYPPQGIRPASIHLFRRIFSKRRQELFESFRTGTVLTFDFMVREDQSRCPDTEQFRNMLSFVGEYLGLSQFGSKFGFGRFQVLDIKLKIYGREEKIERVNQGAVQSN
jgi:hypothetical protein